MDRPIVLIVDDEPLIAAMVGMTLDEAGFEVRTVMDAVEASAQIADLDTRLAALITDVQLGEGANGWAVAAEARRRLPLLPVVYMTGDSAADWTACGVPKSILVPKPFVGAQVLAAVTTLMNPDQCDSAPPD